jgi:hypothetical protein
MKMQGYTNRVKKDDIFKLTKEYEKVLPEYIKIKKHFKKNSICIGEADAFQHIKIYLESKI